MYAKESKLLSAFPGLINQINQVQQSESTQARSAYISLNYSDSEQGIIDEIAAAFKLLPDKNQFFDEIERINEKITNNVQSSERQQLLYSVVENSYTTALFWLEYKDEIVTDLNASLANVANGRIQGCSWSWGDFGKEVVGGAAAGAVGGAIVGGSVSFGTLTVPGWVAGGIAGGAGGAAYYSVSQAWDCIF